MKLLCLLLFTWVLPQRERLGAPLRDTEQFPIDTWLLFCYFPPLLFLSSFWIITLVHPTAERDIKSLPQGLPFGLTRG